MKALRASGARFRAGVGPWLWMPALLLVALQWRLLQSVTLSASELAIPIAALLGHRYQRRGLAVVALGGLLLPIGWSYAFVSVGPHLDLYLAALLVCALAGAKRPLVESVPSFRPSLLFFATLLMLPLAIWLYGANVGDVRVVVVLRFHALLYLLLFTLGLARFRVGLVIAALAACTLLGILLETLGLPRDARTLFGDSRAQFPLFGPTELRYLWIGYGLDSPAAFLTGLGYFLVGREFASLEESHPLAPMPWYRTYGAVLLLAVLALGSELNRYAISGRTGVPLPPYFRLLGSFFALPCAALLGGLLLRYRGLFMVLVLVPLFWWLDGLLRSGFNFRTPWLFLPLHEPFSVLGFGALGLALRDIALRTRTVWSRRWTLYVLLFLLVLPSWIAPNSPLQVLLLALGFVGSIVLGTLTAWLSKRLLGWLPTHGGWLSLVSLLCLGALLWQHYATATIVFGGMPQLFAEILRGLSGGEVDLELANDTLIFPTMGLVFLWLLLSAAYGFLRHVPDCARDLKGLARALHMTLPGMEDGRDDDAQPQAPLLRVSTCLWMLLVQIVGVVRYLALGLAIALPLLLLLIGTFP